MESKSDWLRSEIEKLEMMEKDDLPKKLLNPFYPQEGEKYLKMEGNINFMNGYNQALTSIITRYKEELKVLEK